METTNQPLVTFALFAYNQERFITEAVQGALSQTYSPLEIILSDDCSPDRTFEIMQELAAQYQGPHTVVLNRNATNLGLVGHLNRVMEIVKGELIVAAAGDDVSLPNRTERIVDGYCASKKEALSLFSNAWLYSEDGKVEGLLKRRPNQFEYDARFLASRMETLTGATHAWHRVVFDFFGPLNEAGKAEDTMIPLRSALLGHVVYLNEPLLYYRTDKSRLRVDYKWMSSQILREDKLIARLSSQEITLQQRLQDIQRVNSSQPERSEELAHLYNTTRGMLQSIQDKRTFAAADFWIKARILFQYCIKQSEVRRDFLRWSLDYLFPKIIVLRMLVYYQIRRSQQLFSGR